MNNNFWLLNGGSIVPGIVNYLFYCIVFIAAAELALRRLVLGRWVYAVGSNDKAAGLLGIPVRGVRFRSTSFPACSPHSRASSVCPISAMPRRPQART